MDELAKHFADLAAQYGPAVAEAAKAAVRVEVQSTLMGSLIALAFAVAMGLIGKALWHQRLRDDLDAGFVKFIAGLCWLIAGICTAIFVWNWIDPWTWMALAHPELWLAKKAFGL